MTALPQGLPPPPRSRQCTRPERGRLRVPPERPASSASGSSSLGQGAPCFQRLLGPRGCSSVSCTWMVAGAEGEERDTQGQRRSPWHIFHAVRLGITKPRRLSFLACHTSMAGARALARENTGAGGPEPAPRTGFQLNSSAKRSTAQPQFPPFENEKNDFQDPSFLLRAHPLLHSFFPRLGRWGSHWFLC